MNIGIIGLGKMGKAIAHRAKQGNFNVIGYDPNTQAQEEAEKYGISCVSSLQELAQQTQILWIMVPVAAVDDILKELIVHTKPGTIIIDGGNSKFTDSIRRAEQLKKLSISFLDCGTSGGLRGETIGFSLMIGGERQAFDAAKDIFRAIAAPEGFCYIGPSGTGHYVKMIHNGIEYALLQAYAEGFHLLKEGHFNNLDLAAIASVWRNGSVIRSWILELCHEIFIADQQFTDISGKVAESGMGKWTVEEAHEHSIPVQLIEDALHIRFWSQESGGNYATKLVALLRNKFGGHSVEKETL